jgi:hypothetical protein
MKAEEIRIGNWIKDMRADKCFEVISRDIEDVDYSNENYEGIPLTPQILEACGFKGDDSKNDYEFMYLHLKNYNDYESWIVTKNGYDINPGMPLLKSLHQLQNFYFAFTGNELEVSLHIEAL